MSRTSPRTCWPVTFGFFASKRDGFRSSGAIQEYSQLVDLVNRLNAEWVVAMRRMSPRLLRDFLAFTGPEVEACLASLNPIYAGDAVGWAGRSRPAMVRYLPRIHGTLAPSAADSGCYRPSAASRSLLSSACTYGRPFGDPETFEACDGALLQVLAELGLSSLPLVNWHGFRTHRPQVYRAMGVEAEIDSDRQQIRLLESPTIW